MVSLSTTEAEFIATAACACQSAWMRRVLKKLGVKQVSVSFTVIIVRPSSFRRILFYMEEVST